MEGERCGHPDMASEVDDRIKRAAELLEEGHTDPAVADAIGVSARTIRRWRKAGKLAAASGNGAGREVSARTRIGHDPDIDPHRWTKAEAERRKAIALARKHELDMAEREGRLVPVEAVDEVLGPVLDRLRRAILNIEGRWATHFGPCEPREAAETLRRLTRELLVLLSEAGLPQQEKEPLPDGFPGRSWLVKAGVETVDELLALEDLRSVHGIGPVTERRIVEWLEEADAA